MTLKETSDLTRGLAPWVMFLIVSGAGLGLALRTETVAGQQIQRREETLVRPLRSRGAEVHGYVVAGGQSTAAATSLHFLPDITVYLRNLTTHTESPRVQTDLKGFFMVPQQPAGKYELCLESPGYVSACPRQLTIAGQMVFLPPTPIMPKRRALTGVVLLKGGGPCTFSDPVLGVQFDTRVRVVGANDREMAPPVRANFAGQYLVPAVPAGSFQVTAACEAAAVTKKLSLAGGSMVANLTLPNQPPSLVTVVARQGNRALRRAGPGETVEITASARDSDDLHYSWAVSGSAKPFQARDSKTVQWTLPASPGLHSIYVLVRDGKGGVSLGRRDLSTDASSLLFTGTAQEPSGRPVEGAEVELSGLRGGEATERPITARTNKAGNFFLAPKEESDRYVLTIRKPGYQILSRVLTGPIVGGRYELVPAQKFSFNAGQGGQLAEKGDSRCSTASQTWSNQYWGRYSLRERIERWRRDRRRCGAQVIIPPGALVDGNGKVFSGTVSASVSSVDLRDPSRFPGEYGGLNRDRREVGLNSLGVVDVTLTDSNGQPLKLAASQTAVVRIPIDPLQLGLPGMPASPPATIPIWFYDSKTGIWNEEGEGKLVGDYYEAVVKHFSSINADVEFTTPACMRVHTDATKIPIPYQLRVSIPAAAPVKVITQTIDDPLSVVVRLPENTNVKFEVLDSAGNVIQLATKIQQTNGTSSPTFPVYDYASCTSDVNLTLVAPTNSGFLDYFGGYANNAVEADEYYSKVDPVATPGTGTVSSAGTTVTGAGGANFTAPFFEAGHIIRAAGQVRTIASVTNSTTLDTETAFSPPLPAGTTYERVGVKQTLASWKTANGFGADDQDAVYLNKPDLGLGRWMHKKVNGGNIAYYVSNYGVPPNFGSADIAAFAKLTNNPSLGLIATVAMEYSPHPTLPGGSYTKFYVFNAAGARINKADLDGNGAKYVPKLCMVCHGGAPGSVTSDVRGDGLAGFIPFDAESLGYATIDDPLNPGAFTQAGQETAFKEMNRGIRDLTNVSPANLELIEGWYGGATLPGAAQSGGYVHKGWRLTGTGTPAGTSPVDKTALYNQVVKPSCRSCHNTRNSFVSWDTWDGPGAFDGFKEEGGTIKALVCGPTRVMPHAKVTFNNFWLSTNPHRPAALGNGGLDSFAPSDPCPTP